MKFRRSYLTGERSFYSSVGWLCSRGERRKIGNKGFRLCWCCGDAKNEMDNL